MRWLLDTNVVSELRRSSRADPLLLAWATSIAASETCLSVITVLEIERGAQLVARRDPTQGLVLRQWIERDVMPRYSGRILPIDTAVAQRCAALHIPDPRADRDALIAATALVHGLTVVTHNVSDFAPTTVPVFNPWS